MKSSEAKVVAQCVADMIDVKTLHSIRHVPLALNKLVTNYLVSYVPDVVDSAAELVITGSSVKDKEK
jgi:hypothetical protein